MPNIPASATKIIYMYYGNPDAESLSNGGTTFEFFDDFQDSVIDTAKWVIDTDGGSINETSGQLQLEKYANGTGVDAITNTNFSGEYMMECSVIIPSAGGGNAVRRQRINSLDSNGQNTSSIDKGLYYESEYLIFWNSSTSVNWSMEEEYRHKQRISASINTWEWVKTNGSVLYSNYYTPSAQPAKFKFIAGDDGGNLLGSLYLNWVFVRKYTSCEPIVSLQNEEYGKKIVFLTSPIYVEAGIPREIAIQIQDFTGTPVNVSQNTIISLYTTSSGGKFYNIYNQRITEVTIPAGQNYTSFIYEDTKAGASTIRCSETPSQGWVDAEQTEVIYFSHPYKVGFVVQPSTTAAGQVITPAVEIAVQDFFGNTVMSDDSTEVTISISTNPVGGSLTGTTTKVVSRGVVVFDDLKIDKAGQGYRLKAEASGLNYSVSEPFDMTVASITKITFISLPQVLQAGVVSSTMVIQAQNIYGNAVNVNEDVIIRLKTTSLVGKFYKDASGSIEISSVTIPAGHSSASFYYKDMKVGISTITCSEEPDRGWTDAEQQQTIIPASAYKLVFVVQPSTTAAGQVITPAIQVAVQDQYGNIVNSDNNTQVSISIHTNPANGTLSGTTTKKVSNGIATFDDLSINTPGKGYDLEATATGLISVISEKFNIIAFKIININNNVKIMFLDTDNNLSNGYEEFISTSVNLVLKFDIDTDGKNDYIVSIDAEGKLLYYINLANDIITEVLLTDYDGDGVLDYGIDISGNGKYSKYWNKVSGKLLEIPIIEQSKGYTISPNPYSSSSDKPAVVVYDIEKDGDVTIDIYTISGEKVCVLVDGFRQAGRHQVRWNGGNGEFDAKDGELVGSNNKLARGIYIMRFKLPSKTYFKKIAIIK